MPASVPTIGLLIASNVFMTFAWYGHLKFRSAGAMVVEAALALADVSFTFRPVPSPASDEERAAFASVNPRGQVPALIHPDGTVISEGPAILGHLADAFRAAGLAPPPGSAARLA